MSLVRRYLLDDFGYYLHDIYGDWPYQVGTSVLNKTWNDVDVRIILDDAEYERAGYGDPEYPERNPKWVSTCLALSQFGRVFTGLPIDCQIQQQTYANEHFSQKDGCVRSTLGITRKLREQIKEASR